MKRFIIVEDEPLAAQALRDLLLEMRPDWTLVASADSVQVAVEQLSQTAADIIFMDIHLSDGLSFSIFEKIKPQVPVVFTTAFDQYAIRAFQVNGFDYLLKPILPSELQRVLDKFEQNVHVSPSDLSKLLDQFNRPPREYKSRFLVKIADKLVSVPIESIAYFYSDEKHTWLAYGKELYPLEHTLDALESMVDPAKFFRLNRKVLASFSSIHKIYNHLNGKLKIELSPSFDQEIFVSREKAREFKEWLDR
ncbi:MAG: LytTR family DNA-binding domain-containing protein [Cytophagaceae bacterium]|jgi:DNA-binding LytR/AlgR family response regulator|nr:LytTR family DNA-binding domain-containing protein [Cytophagaceae bacterium]